MNVLAELVRVVESGETCALATIVAAQGSTPRKAGARLVVTASGRQFGTVGGGELESAVLAATRDLLSGKEASCVLELPACGGTVTVYLERFAPVRQVLVVGAGHVGGAVARAAAAAGYRVTVVSPSALPGLDDTPDVTVLHTRSAVALADLQQAEATHVIVATGEHDADLAWAVAALTGSFASVGVVGGPRKAEAIRAQAEATGIAPNRVAMLRCPVGLAIGAVTPAEIAVSIVAELVMLDRNREVPPSWRIQPSA